MFQGRIDWRGRLHLASAVVKSSVFHFSSFPVQGQGGGPHMSSELLKKSSRRKTCSSAMAQHETTVRQETSVFLADRALGERMRFSRAISFADFT